MRRALAAVAALSFALSFPAYAMELTGVVSSINGNNILFREGASDTTVRLDKLTPEQVKIFTSPEAKTKIFKISINDEAIASSAVKPFGLRGDCTELPFSAKEVAELANNPKVKNIEDFLRLMPKGAMESYTYVTNSLSAQRGTGDTMVNEMWPRVLRTTMDGKLTISWTCNPKSETHNHIEVFYFDDKEQKYQTMSIKLNRPPGEGPANRVHHNPGTCVECHSNGKKIMGDVSLKPNWQQYFFWGDCDRRRGITTYGMSDDQMNIDNFRNRFTPTQDDRLPGCDSTKDFQAHKDQVRDFQKFQELQKDNPCYNLLPKPNPSMNGNPQWDYKSYPYAQDAQKRVDGIMNYSLRTNLRFTDTYSHQMSKRNLALLKKHPAFEKLKYFLALEAGKCLQPSDEAAIKKLVPGLEYSKPLEVNSYSAADPRSAPLLYNFSRYIGMEDADWTMEFNRKNNPVYVSAMPRAQADTSYDSDGGIKDGVFGVLLAGIAKENKEVGPMIERNLSRGVSEFFGPNFSCIDDQGGFLRAAQMSTDRSSGKYCADLRAANEKHLKNLPADTVTSDKTEESGLSLDELKVICKKEIEDALTPIVDTLAKIRDELLGKDTPVFRASVARGRELVQHGKGQCIKCHSATSENVGRRPANFLFVPNESLSKESQERSLAVLRNRIKEGFADEIEDQLWMGMPPIRGVSLDEQEKKDIVNYYKSLATGVGGAAP